MQATKRKSLFIFFIFYTNDLVWHPLLSILLYHALAQIYNNKVLYCVLIVWCM